MKFLLERRREGNKYLTIDNRDDMRRDREQK